MTNRQTYERQTYKQTDRQANNQIGRHTDRSTDRKADRKRQRQKLDIYNIHGLCYIRVDLQYPSLSLSLSLQTLGIAAAAYNQDWSHADVRYRKSQALIIQRSQKPAYLQGTIFIQITRGSMTDVSAFNLIPYAFT